MQLDDSSILQRISIRQIYLLAHHKEIGLAVDTFKYIVVAYPNSCRLVVNGIDEKFKCRMKEMIESITRSPNKRIVLFPTGSAKTFGETRKDCAI